MCASATALAAFEIAVAGRSTAFAIGEYVVVHREAHRASGVAPFETGVDENLCQSLFLGLLFDLHRTGNDHRPDIAADVIAAGDACRFAEVLDTRIRTRSDKRDID